MFSVYLFNKDPMISIQALIFRGTRQNRSGSDLNGDNLLCGSQGSIFGSVITVGLRSGFGLGLQIVVYKLLEKVTKCGSIT